MDESQTGMPAGTTHAPDRAVEIDLGAVQETLVIPLWARAREAEKSNPIVFDPLARDIVAKLDYDFSKIEQGQRDHQKVWAIRAYNFDVVVEAFLARNSDAAVVNIGAGLDTTFPRVDNGTAIWVNLDLPDVVALRRRLIPDTERETTVAKSVFDFTWLEDISRHRQGRAIMFIAAGVLCYFDEQQVAALLRKLADACPGAQLAFDAMSRFTVWGSNRAILKRSGIDSSALLKWHLNRASQLKRWVKTIEIIEEYPMLSRLPARHSLKLGEVLGLKIADLFRFYQLVHVRL